MWKCFIHLTFLASLLLWVGCPTTQPIDNSRRSSGILPSFEDPPAATPPALPEPASTPSGRDPSLPVAVPTAPEPPPPEPPPEEPAPTSSVVFNGLVRHVNAAKGFVVFEAFPGPPAGRKLFIIRNRETVGHLRVTAPRRIPLYTADLLDGEVRIGDRVEARE